MEMLHGKSSRHVDDGGEKDALFRHTTRVYTPCMNIHAILHDKDEPCQHGNIPWKKLAPDDGGEKDAIFRHTTRIYIPRMNIHAILHDKGEPC